MARKLIDLSMPVHNDMVVFPRVVRPALVMYETWQQFAERVGAAKYGATSLTASYMVVLGDHVGTHIDSLRHLREDAPGAEGIPLEYCFGDGVCLRPARNGSTRRIDCPHTKPDNPREQRR